MQFLKKILMIGLLALPVCGFAAESNTRTAISAPKQSYPLLYTVNAKSAGLVSSVNGYHITLRDTEPKVAYKSADGKSGMVPLTDFVKYLQGKSAVIKADVSGVQTNNKTRGQETFYASFTLSKVVLSTRDSFLRFEAEPLNPDEIHVDKMQRFDNVTVFINGCGVCGCGAVVENCVK